jgi:hypothetical protein
MSAFTRTQNVMDDPDDWAAAHPTETPDSDPEVTSDRRQWAELDLGSAVGQVTAGLDLLDKTVASSVDRWLIDTLEYGHAAELVDWLQAAKRRLAVVEAYVARELIKDPGTPDKIELPDGRIAEVLRGATRKAWDHSAWQGDVRKAVLGDGSAELVDPATGEPVNVHDLLAAVQAVHSSAGPKATALKALGLSAGDYCETLPGTISVKISAPASETPTTIQEN